MARRTDIIPAHGDQPESSPSLGPDRLWDLETARDVRRAYAEVARAIRARACGMLMIDPSDPQGVRTRPAGISTQEAAALCGALSGALAAGKEERATSEVEALRAQIAEMGERLDRLLAAPASPAQGTGVAAPVGVPVDAERH